MDSTVVRPLANSPASATTLEADPLGETIRRRPIGRNLQVSHREGFGLEWEAGTSLPVTVSGRDCLPVYFFVSLAA